ncbi:TIP-1 family-domain-containing protein [Coemansia spiralis]|nr:TIP-1 family-domain-containing protein [Coemansia spiralis]
MSDIANEAASSEVKRFLDGHFTNLESLELVSDLLRDEKRTHALLEQELNTAHESTQAVFTEARGIAKKVNDEALKLVDLHSKVVGSTADESVSAWQFRDGTEIMQLISLLAAKLGTYRKLNQAKEYIDVVVDIEQTKANAAQCLSMKDSRGVLDAYSHAVDVLSKQFGTGDLARQQYLLEHIRMVVLDIWKGAESAAASTQNEALVRLGWPGKMDMSMASTIDAFDAGFSMLASLDCINRKNKSILMRSSTNVPANKTSPLPLEHLARAVDIRMRYHFESMRSTNRVDKPEWWLSQVLGMVRNIVPFLESHVQHIYEESQLPELDARNEFLQLVQPIIQRKLTNDRSEYLKSGFVISHIARELANFERTLCEVYFFDGPSILKHFLSDSDIFAAWVEAERANATAAYMETINDPGAFDLVYDDDVLGIDDAKPSRIAEKVVLLVEDVAERYSAVPSCMQRLQLLSTAQFPIIIALVEDVEEEIDEFNRISLAFIRESGIAGSVGSSANPGQSSFITQLSQLASWYQTIWYVEEAARDWNNSVLYVDMWDAVCRRAQVLDGGMDPRDWRDDCDSWDARDRRLLDEASQQEIKNIDWIDGGIWERTIGTLEKLKQRVLELISKAINKDIVGQLRAFRKKSNWVVDDEKTGSSFDVSVELSGALPGLAQVISSLANMLPFVAFTRLMRSLSSEIDIFITERVACAHSFNVGGGSQLALDVEAIGRVLTSSAPRADLRRPNQRVLPKANECALILSCSLDGTSSSSRSNNNNDNAIPLALNEWGHAIASVSTDSQEAQQVLKKLGISHISVKEARRLIEIRVDFTDAVSD